MYVLCCSMVLTVRYVWVDFADVVYYLWMECIWRCLTNIEIQGRAAYPQALPHALLERRAGLVISV